MQTNRTRTENSKILRSAGWPWEGIGRHNDAALDRAAAAALASGEIERRAEWLSHFVD